MAKTIIVIVIGIVFALLLVGVASFTIPAFAQEPTNDELDEDIIITKVWFTSVLLYMNIGFGLFILWIKINASNSGLFTFFPSTQNIRNREKGKVNVDTQMFFSVIPVILVLAFFRINKLRKGIFLVISLGYISFLTAFFALESFYLGFIIGCMMYIPPIIYFMRKWSKEWNKNLETTDSTF